MSYLEKSESRLPETYPEEKTESFAARIFRLNDNIIMWKLTKYSVSIVILIIIITQKVFPQIDQQLYNSHLQSQGVRVLRKNQNSTDSNIVLSEKLKFDKYGYLISQEIFRFDGKTKNQFFHLTIKYENQHKKAIGNSQNETENQIEKQAFTILFEGPEKFQLIEININRWNKYSKKLVYSSNSQVRYQYDSAGRLVSILSKSIGGTYSDSVINFYNETGRVVEKKIITPIDTISTKFIYDTNGNLSSSVEQNRGTVYTSTYFRGNDTLPDSIITTWYAKDTRFLNSKKILLSYDAHGNKILEKNIICNGTPSFTSPMGTTVVLSQKKISYFENGLIEKIMETDFRPFSFIKPMDVTTTYSYKYY